MNVHRTLKTQADLDFFSNGTKDQKGFSVDIRRAFADEAKAYRPTGASSEMLAIYDKSINFLLAKTDVNFWLKWKDASAKDLVEKVMKSYLKNAQ